MDTLVPDSHHPALDVPESERVDYLVAVGSMALADNATDERELARIREMCTALKLSVDATATVLARCAATDDDQSDSLADIITRLADSDLRFALMIDAIDIACADDEVVPEEAAELESLANHLNISTAQLAMLRRYVETQRLDSVSGEADPEITAGLAGAGVPAAALAVATVVGAPLIAGVGAAAALGLGSYVSVRWLMKRARRKSD